MSLLESNAAPVKEGEILAGKYRVERVIGRGGMGVVVAAINVRLEQRVALKFLLDGAVRHPEIVARFAREARAAAKIQCDHVARVLDVDTLPSGAPFMVMEYMDGYDLETTLARSGPLAVEVAVSYVLQACEALAEAHAVGIVHRDLKPANLFLANRPNGEPIVKVVDFGISKSMSPDDPFANLTRTASVMGSPLYMSPEQMTSAKMVDLRSDIWAMGIVLFELLTCTTPFTADGLPNLVLAVVHSEPVPLRARRPGVPEGLEVAVKRCLEKDPRRRFASVAELAAAIAPFGTLRARTSVDRISHVLRSVGGAPGSPIGVPTRPTDEGFAPTEALNAQPTPVPNITSQPWTKSAELPEDITRARRGLPWAGVAAGALLVVGVTAFALSHAGAGSTAAAEPPASAPVAAAPDPVASTSRSAAAEPTPEPVAARAHEPALSPTPHPVAAHPEVAPSRAKPAVAPARSAAPAPDCSVPYMVDSAGHRIPRQECI